MALPVGSPAPQFMLPGLNGGEFDLHEALGHGPVLLAFFKVSCPVCQFTFPFLERLYRAYGNEHFTLRGISQDNVSDTKRFMKEFAVTFPVLLDEPSDYVVSNAFGLTNVPSIFWIDPNGHIGVESVGWEKAALESINLLAADFSRIPRVPVFHDDEQVPAFRAG